MDSSESSLGWWIKYFATFSSLFVCRALSKSIKVLGVYVFITSIAGPIIPFTKINAAFCPLRDIFLVAVSARSWRSWLWALFSFAYCCIIVTNFVILFVLTEFLRSTFVVDDSFDALLRPIPEQFETEKLSVIIEAIEVSL